MAYRVSRRDFLDQPAYYVTESDSEGRSVKYTVLPSMPEYELLPRFENIRQRRPRKVYIYNQNDQTMFNIIYADGTAEDVEVGEIIKGDHINIEKIRDLLAWQEEGAYRMRRRPRARSLSPPRSHGSRGSFVVIPSEYRRRRSLSPPRFRTILSPDVDAPRYYVPSEAEKYTYAPSGRPDGRYVYQSPREYYEDYYRGLTDDIYKWNQWRTSLDQIPMASPYAWQYPSSYNIPRPQVKIAPSMGYYDGYMVKDMDVKNAGNKVLYTTIPGGLVFPVQNPYYGPSQNQRY